MKLCEKIVFLEKRMAEKHLIDGGLVGSAVEVDQRGNMIDPNEKIFAHAITWTGVYLSGLAFKYAATGDDAVRRHADEVLRCMGNCIRISGTPGVLCRGYLTKHGLTAEEKSGGLQGKICRQGQGEYAEMRYISSPSHHNHDHYIRGMTMYYVLAATEEQKARIREDLGLLGRRVYLDYGMNAVLGDGDPSTAIVFTSHRTPNDCLTMALTNCKMLDYVTGDRRFQALYEDLCGRLDMARLGDTEAMREAMRDYRPDHDDAEHVFPDLYLMHLIEEDPVKRAFYRAYAAVLNEVYRHDLVTPFNFLSKQITGDGEIDEGIDTLTGYDENRFYEPKLNTPQNGPFLRVNDRAPRPVPMALRPIDNELEWKGSPYRCDGWLSRPVRKVAACDEDPCIINVLEENGSYWRSEDGGETFHAMPLPVGTVDVIYDRETMRLSLAAAADGVYRSVSGGMSWEKVGLPGAENAGAQRLYQSPGGVFYAITDKGVYKSLDNGGSMASTALNWTLCEPNIPDIKGENAYLKNNALRITFVGGKAMFCKFCDGRLYKKTEGDPAWSYSKAYFGAFWHLPVLGARVCETSADEIYGITGFTRGSMLFVAKEGVPFLTTLGTAGVTPDGWGRGSGLEDRSVTCFEFIGGAICAGTNNGLFISKNGADFAPFGSGYHIGFIRGMTYVPEHNCLYVDTPSGLYRQDVGGGKAERLLCLNGNGVNRTQCAPTDFIYAYWMGRAFGYIGEND